MVRDRKQIEEQREKLRNLITRVFNINILYKMQEVNDFIRPLKHNLSEVTAQYENRRITNNMISVSNNALRNSYLEKLTGKKCFSADSMSLRYRFNLWKRIGDKMNNHAILLQKNFRKMQARNKADRLLEIKERLYSLALRNEESAKGKLKLALRLWNAKANHLKMLEDAIKIRRFCRSVVAKDDNDNFKKTFVDWSKKITDRRLNNAAKVNNLKDTLRKIYAKIILERVDFGIEYLMHKLMQVRHFNAI